jgi:hypothetical protein
MELNNQNTIESLHKKCATLLESNNNTSQISTNVAQSMLDLLLAIYGTVSDAIPHHCLQKANVYEVYPWNTKEGRDAKHFIYLLGETEKSAFVVEAVCDAMLAILTSESPIKPKKKQFRAILHDTCHCLLFTAVMKHPKCLTIAKAVGATGNASIVNMFLEQISSNTTTVKIELYFELFQHVIKGMCVGFLDDGQLVSAMDGFPGAHKKVSDPEQDYLAIRCVIAISVELLLAGRTSILPMAISVYGCDPKTYPKDLWLVIILNMLCQ